MLNARTGLLVITALISSVGAATAGQGAGRPRGKPTRETLRDHAAALRKASRSPLVHEAVAQAFLLGGRALDSSKPVTGTADHPSVSFTIFGRSSTQYTSRFSTRDAGKQTAVEGSEATYYDRGDEHSKGIRVESSAGWFRRRTTIESWITTTDGKKTPSTTVVTEPAGLARRLGFKKIRVEPVEAAPPAEATAR